MYVYIYIYKPFVEQCLYLPSSSTVIGIRIDYRLYPTIVLTSARRQEAGLAVERPKSGQRIGELVWRG